MCQITEKLTDALFQQRQTALNNLD